MRILLIHPGVIYMSDVSTWYFCSISDAPVGGFRWQLQMYRTLHNKLTVMESVLFLVILLMPPRDYANEDLRTRAEANKQRAARGENKVTYDTIMHIIVQNNHHLFAVVATRFHKQYRNHSRHKHRQKCKQLRVSTFGQVAWPAS